MRCGSHERAAASPTRERRLHASHRFGNLFYAACAQMDEAAFPARRQGALVALLRRLTTPMRRAFFVRSGERPSAANRFFGWLFWRMGF